jgi:VWFA-related protein
MNRVAAALEGGLAPARVRFLLDGAALFTKSRPPFGVELDFGDGTAVHSVAVEALDAAGRVLARDERRVNTGLEPFALALELSGGAPPAADAVARARLTVPRHRRVTRVDYFLGERPFFALEAPPFDQPIPLPPAADTAVVRALARLSDGRTAEDTALLNAPDVVDETSVRLVELYVAVVDRRGRSVAGLAAEEFRVTEDGRPQRIVRFDRVESLPLNLVLVLDVSSSMRQQLAQVAHAATGFLERAVTPADRASLITFNDSPRVAVDFTSDFGRLANGLAGLRAGGRTEIQRALELALRELESAPGQRAILLFSDGIETNPRDAGALVEYARRNGVTLYTVGFAIPSDEVEARELLTRLAEETGGRALFVQDVDELELAYVAVVLEMRSRYLVAYQSDNPDGREFRAVEVGLLRRGLEARAPRGYYP